jgi:hypothetical protein
MKRVQGLNIHLEKPSMLCTGDQGLKFEFKVCSLYKYNLQQVNVNILRRWKECMHNRDPTSEDGIIKIHWALTQDELLNIKYQ